MMYFCLSYHKVQKSARTLTWITPCTARGKATHPAAQELRSSSTTPCCACGLHGVIHVAHLRCDGREVSCYPDVSQSLKVRKDFNVDNPVHSEG